MIAVSGASGFLGSHIVCSLLERGYDVRAMRRENNAMDEFAFISEIRLKESGQRQWKGKLEWFVSDVLDVNSLDEFLAGCESIIHAAAVVSFEAKQRDIMFKINIEGTANMVNAALRNGVKTFCHISSIAAIGRRKSGELIDEYTHWETSKHNSNYSISKYRAELEVWRGAEEGLSTVIVNPGVILGSGIFEKGSIQLLHSIWKGLPFYTRGINGYVDVRDVAKACIDLIEKNIRNQRFILVSESVALSRVFEEAAEALGKRKPYIRVNRTLSEIAWRLYSLKRIFVKGGISITKETARSAQNQYFYSNEKIKKAIGFEFIPVSKSIQEACYYLKEKYSKK